MSDEIDPPPPPDSREANSSGMTVLWLLVAFVPSLAAIPFLRNPPSVSEELWPLSGGCCVFAAFGILRRTKNPASRIVLGLLLAGLLFILNIFAVGIVAFLRWGG
jgi:hypothetical protein